MADSCNLKPTNFVMPDEVKASDLRDATVNAKKSHDALLESLSARLEFVESRVTALESRLFVLQNK